MRPYAGQTFASYAAIRPTWVGPYYASDGAHVWRRSDDREARVQYARGPSSGNWKIPIPIFPPGWAVWARRQNPDLPVKTLIGGPLGPQWELVCTAPPGSRSWINCGQAPYYPPPVPPISPSFTVSGQGYVGQFPYRWYPPAQIPMPVYTPPTYQYAPPPPLPAPPKPPCPPGYTWTAPYTINDAFCGVHEYFPGACCPAGQDYGPSMWENTGNFWGGACPIKPFADCVPPYGPSAPPYNPCQPGWSYNVQFKKCCPPGWKWDPYTEQCVPY